MTSNPTSIAQKAAVEALRGPQESVGIMLAEYRKRVEQVLHDLFDTNPTLKRILGELALAIEGGSTFSEALAQHPKTFNRLFVNMVKAGELGGVLEVVLKRLAEFSEKAQKKAA